MKKIKSLCVILLGNVLLAAGVSVFLLPNHFVSGGATGLGLIVTHFTGIPVSYCVLLFNTVFFLVGAGFLGKRFALTTLLSTVFYPVCLNVLERFSYAGLNENPLLSALGAGVLSGIGLGLVFREGMAVLSVIPKRKLKQAIRLVQKENDNAFITVHEIREVRGREYTTKKDYITAEGEQT